MTISKEFAELEGKFNGCMQDNTRMVEELNKYSVREEIQTQKLQDAESLQKALVVSKTSSEEALEYERSRASAAEATSNALRISMSAMKEELERIQRDMALEQQRVKDKTGRQEDLTHGLSSACVSLFRSCADWDNAISIVLDGTSAKVGMLLKPGAENVSTLVIDDFANLSSFELIRKVTVQIERINLKIERLSKLRNILDAHSTGNPIF